MITIYLLNIKNIDFENKNIVIGENNSNEILKAFQDLLSI